MATSPSIARALKLAVGRGQELDRLEHRGGGHGKHDVELEEAPGLPERDRGVVADDPRDDHRQALDDDRVHLAGHDARPRLGLGQGELAQAGPRPHPQQADVRRDLPQAERDRPDRAVGGDLDVKGGLGVEVVVGLADGQPGEGGQPAARPQGELGMRVDPRADGRAAERHGQELDLGGAGPSQRLLDLAGVAAELLAEADRRGVLEVGPPSLDHGPERLLAGHERGVEGLEGGQQPFLDGDGGRQLQRSRDGVVRALAAVDVVVRMDRTAVKASRGQVGDDLVHVGVGRGARTGLVDVDRELVVVVAVGDRGRCGGDRVGHLRLEQAELRVRLGGRELDEGQRAQEPAR